MLVGEGAQRWGRGGGGAAVLTTARLIQPELAKPLRFNRRFCINVGEEGGVVCCRERTEHHMIHAIGCFCFYQGPVQIGPAITPVGVGAFA